MDSRKAGREVHWVEQRFVSAGAPAVMLMGTRRKVRTEIKGEICQGPKQCTTMCHLPTELMI